MKLFVPNGLRRAGLAASAALFLHACAPNQDTPSPVVGLDVSRYLAVGDSYTAGLSNGGLTRTSQEYSFVNLLARQFQNASSGAGFVQPLFDGNEGSFRLAFNGYSPTGFLQAKRVPGTAVRRTVLLTSACGTAPDTLRLLKRSSTAATLPQNLGVPGLMLSQIDAVGLGNEASVGSRPVNPYFERLLPAGDDRTYFQVLSTAASSATFFSYFMGLDEIMPFVRSGGTCGAIPSSLPMKRAAKRILDVLTANKRPGVIVKLPAITSLPLLSQGRGNEVEARLQAYYKDQLPLYIETPFVPGASQRITDRDYILATALPRLGQPTPVQVGSTTMMLPYGRDSRNPVRDADVLENTTEMVYITAAINDYNNFDPVPSNATTVFGLAGLARIYGLPLIDPSQNSRLFDAGFLFNNVTNSISVNGVVYTAEPVRGNFFSLDFYSLTPRGNGLLANSFIAAINRAYRSNIPALDVNNLPSTTE
ncbi:hypothetical protein [Hymenobacter armeniacus]|uniref:SGNH/GDSL hydrolase family protein n=1 Tax=Hymenobacter armeniacus TaxID=2771358 RepID=A0ABR8JZ26_9BACT|nr:hypothetical protein [Hymenobacter armeniacus]MBD2724126.1 hypothetical protein [Hymenobacter armeniacus]